MKKTLIPVMFLAAICCFAQSSSSSSQEVMSNGNQEPTLLDESPKLSFSGFFDTYYFGNLNRPSSRTNLGNSGISRGFDRYCGQFQLGMLMFRTEYKFKSVKLVSEVGWGPNVEYGSYGSDFRYRWGSVLANNTTSAVMIKQAYIDYQLSKNLSLQVGQFGTHIGFEYIDSPLNFHYSINNTFNAGTPFYHLGAKATYQLNEKISLMGGLVNGTDNINDNNRGKSFIGQIAINPAEGLTIFFNTIQGNEANTRASGRDTTSYFGVLDLNGSYQVSDRLTFAFWVLHGTEKGEFQGGKFFKESRHWTGLNLYATVILNDVLSVGSRIEYFNNKSGARALLTNGNGTSARTVTVTTSIKLAEGRLLVKPEFRMDVFNKIKIVGEENNQQFAGRDGVYSKNTQTTIGAAAILKF
jgi:hypothetical protein